MTGGTKTEAKAPATKANKEIWKMVSMGFAGCGWSGLACSFLLGHLDITLSLTLLGFYSLTVLAGSEVYVLTTWQRQYFASYEGTGVGVRQGPGLEPQLSHLPWDLG